MSWESSTLRDLCDEGEGAVKTGPFGSQLHESDYSETGTPVIMPSDIDGSNVSTESIARVNEDHVKRLSQHKVSSGDIVFPRRGNIKKHAYITTRESGWLCGTGCLRIRLGDSQVLPQYLQYYLYHEPVVAEIESQAVGSTMANLNTGILEDLEVRYPPLCQQRKISTILSSYDDLINNNRDRISILEQMAQSIYQEWFVHYQFTDRKDIEMVDSQAGQVPKGWEVKPFSEAVQIKPRERPDKEKVKPHVPMGSISTDSMVIEPIKERDGNRGAKYRNGDTLFARITPSLENGKTGYVQFLDSDETIGLGSGELITFRSRELCPELVYLIARDETFRQNAIKSMTGASGRQRVQTECFDDYLIAVPPRKVLDDFQEIVKPVFDMVFTLSNRIGNIEKMRNLLLPRLISGELDLSELDIDIDTDT